MVEDIVITQENGDTYSAVFQGEDCWLLSWPEGDLRFYGTAREARTQLNTTYRWLQKAKENDQPC